MYGIRIAPIKCKKYADKPKYIKYYGQELNTSTYNLARMNMFLHGIAAENQKLRNGDTLDGDWPTGEETDFDMVLMNPPYSQNGARRQDFYRMSVSVIMVYWHQNQKQIMLFYCMDCII